MQPPTPPNAVALEVVATQPTEADKAAIAHLSKTADTSLAPVTYLVKVRLDPMPPATSHGWALYVNDFRVPKYWEYKDGIYFKIFDPQFFHDHQGGPLRFSPNGTDFTDTGLVLADTDVNPQMSSTEAADLPQQADLLE